MRRTPEDLIEDIRSYMAANYFNEPLTGILEEAANTIEILLHEKKSEPDRTNGDVMMEMHVDHIVEMTELYDGRTPHVLFDPEWWNAEYKEESCEGCANLDGEIRFCRIGGCRRNQPDKWRPEET